MKQGVHYLVHLMGNGHKCYEWVSKETGQTRQYCTTSFYEWQHFFGKDVTILPKDYCHG